MKGFVYILVLGFGITISGCNSLEEEYQIPSQDFSKAMELKDTESGSLFGQIVFPSEYTQRSLTFTVDGRNFVTMPDGRFLVESIPTGEHRLVVSVKGYESINKAFSVSEEEPTAAGIMKLEMARGKVIGRLVNEKGQSAQEIPIKLAPLGGLAVSDNDGIFQFIGVNSGPHVLKITDSKFFTFDRSIQIEQGEIRNLGNIKVFRRTLPIIQQTARFIGE